MKNLHSFTSCLLALCCVLGAQSAMAQYSTPVTVKNTEANPVPVVSADRQPYQFTYFLSAAPASVEDCEAIPVPAGKTLTVTSIAVDARILAGEVPSVYFLAGYGGSAIRFSDSLNFISASGSSRTYRGVYNTNFLIGDGDGTLDFRGAICVDAPPGGSAVGNSARGVVTGFVESGIIIDGRQLP